MHNHNEFVCESPNVLTITSVYVYIFNIKFNLFGLILCCFVVHRSFFHYKKNGEKFETRKHTERTHISSFGVECVILWIWKKYMCVWQFLHINWLPFCFFIGNLEANAIPESITMRSNFNSFFCVCLILFYCMLWYGYHCATSFIFFFSSIRTKKKTTKPIKFKLRLIDQKRERNRGLQSVIDCPYCYMHNIHDSNTINTSIATSFAKVKPKTKKQKPWWKRCQC